MPSPPAPLFPIVGIGASAGGLEALEKFLARVPPGSGLAFVVVQHLDPTVEDMLPELLQRITAMTVLQARDHMRVSPNCVYVIPPNKDLALRCGQLRLTAPGAARGLRLPIDFFLRSLAAERGEQSIGVILSGMGSDGCLGLRAIKEQGGLCLAQDPAGARFASMPQAAVDTALVDLVGPPEELPRMILDMLQRSRSFSAPTPAAADPDDQALGQVAALLRARTGHEFSLYKRNTVMRRIDRRMGVHQVAALADYVRYLEANPAEVDLLFRELLIGVTSFFRDPALWEVLGQEVLPALCAGRPAGSVLRAWVPGCSTGEEAYGLAILFREALARARPARDLQPADLRHRPGPGRHRPGPARAVQAQHRRRRVRRAPEPVLRGRGGRVPGAPGDPGDGGVRHPEPHHGPPVHPARPAQLPQPADLPARRSCRSGSCGCSTTAWCPAASCAWAVRKASAP